MSLNLGQIETGNSPYKAGVKRLKKNEYNRRMRRLPIGEEYKIGKYKGYN